MKELAQEYGFAYEVVTADIDEQALGDRSADPATLVTLLAQAKAEAIRKSMESKSALPLIGFLLTCDQVVICQDKIREKPMSQQQVHLNSFTQWHQHCSHSSLRQLGIVLTGC